MTDQARGRRAGWLLAAAFLVLLVPACLDETRYHGDERFYTDAAISIVESGDWLSPRYPDGRLRVEKPILSYWVLASSYETLGVSLFASRFPFALAGALVVGMTFELGLALLRDRRVALLGAAIMASNPHLVTISTRSTPDVLVVASLLVSFVGFARLLRGERSRGALALAWLGGGAAVAAKGGLGVVWVATVVVFALFLPDRRERVRGLFDRVFFPIGLLVGAWGFGSYALAHGASVLATSLHDQTGGARGPGAAIGRGLAAYLRVPLEQFAPWLVLLGLALPGARQAAADWLRANRSFVRLALVWLGVVVVVFSFGSLVRGRYLAPAYPPIALVLAGVLVATSRVASVEARLRKITRGLLAVVAGAALVGGIFAARVGGGVAFAAGALAGASAGAWLATRGRPAQAALVAFGVVFLVAQTAVVAGIRSRFARAPVDAIASRLLAPDLAGRRIAQVGDSAHLASKLRVATAGLAIDGHTRGAAVPDPSRYDVIVSDQPFDDSVAAAGFGIERCGDALGDRWTFDEVLDVLRAKDPAAEIEKRAQAYWLAIRE